MALQLAFYPKHALLLFVICNKGFFLGSAAESVLTASDVFCLVIACTDGIFPLLQKEFTSACPGSGSCIFFCLHQLLLLPAVCIAHTGAVHTVYEASSLLRPGVLNSAVVAAVATQP